MTDYTSFYRHQSQIDPTRTITLRAKFVADWERRLNLLKSLVLKNVVENDCFGLLGPEERLSTMADEKSKFAYRWSQDKVKGFMDWLKAMESQTVLEIVTRGSARAGEPWSNTYILSAYQKGLATAVDEVRKNSQDIAKLLGIEDNTPTFRPTGSYVSMVLQQPFHADRLGLLYTRAFEELKGVAGELDKAISQVLTKGMAMGLNPRQLGKLLVEGNPDIHLGSPFKKARTRGDLIARTEVINAHSNANLNEIRNMEERTGEVFLVRWRATMDDRVREEHAHWNNLVMTQEEAQLRIGAPNCRCAQLPYIPAAQGMPEYVTDDAKALCKRVLGEEQTEKAIKFRLKPKPKTVSKELTPKELWEQALGALDPSKQVDMTPAKWMKIVDQERKAYYNYMNTVPEREYWQAREEIIRRIVHDPNNEIGVETFSNLAKGLRQYPIDILDQMERQGYKIFYNDQEGRSSFISWTKTSRIYEPVFKNLDNVVSHEWAHALDDYLGGNRGCDLKWEADKVNFPEHKSLTSAVDALKKEFNTIKGTAKGVYPNGDGEYWLDNWVDAYEGRIYSDGATPEWWAMVNSYHHEYLGALDDYDFVLGLLETEIKKEPEGSGSAWFAARKKENMLEEGKEAWAIRQHRADRWRLATERYPVLTGFLKSFLNKRVSYL